jgi:hypothetical protein
MVGKWATGIKAVTSRDGILRTLYVFNIPEPGVLPLAATWVYEKGLSNIKRAVLIYLSLGP